MKKLLTILTTSSLIFLMFFSINILDAQGKVTLVKSIPVDYQETVIELPNQPTITEWDKDYIRIITTIETTNSTDDILNKLVTLGRYSLEMENVNGLSQLHMPKIDRTVFIKGIELEEKLGFEIFVPSNHIIKVKCPSNLTSSL